MTASLQNGHRAARAIAGKCLAMRSRRLGRLITRMYEEALRPTGMTTAQLNILVAVTIQEPTRSSDVARLLGLEKSTLSRNLARMVEAGWVRTTEDTDGRALLLETTPAGLRLLEKAYPAWQRAQEATRKKLGPTAFDALESMTEAIRED